VRRAAVSVEQLRCCTGTIETPHNLQKLQNRCREHNGRRSYRNVSQMKQDHILRHIAIRSILISSNLRLRLPNNLWFISDIPPEISHAHRYLPFQMPSQSHPRWFVYKWHRNINNMKILLVNSVLFLLGVVLHFFLSFRK